MPDAIGHIEALFRYPVKSMAGERLEAADLGWHGIEGDRRFALRKENDQGHMPWLTASKLADLVRFTPIRRDAGPPDGPPSHVRTPEGLELPIFSDELAAEIARRHGAAVQMLQFKNGIFDDATISVIATETIDEISRLSEVAPDVRRFRPNVLVRLEAKGPFQEDRWIGGMLTLGDGPAAPAASVTLRDLRCSMVNIDPDTAASSPGVLKAVARLNEVNAGVYGTVVRTGRLSIGQPVFLHRS